MTAITSHRRHWAVGAVIGALALLVATLPPLGGRAADHLDAPGMMPPDGNIQADINDLYAFAGSEDTTVLAATVVPLAIGSSFFGTDVLYEFKIDTDFDAVEDVSFEVTFRDLLGGDQSVIVRRAEGAAAVDGVANGTVVSFGIAGDTLNLNGGGQVFTGLRSDPFFFDLTGFQGTVEGAPNGRMLNDGNSSDFFEPLDVLGIVLEIPDFSGPIATWMTTSSGGEQIDRMGRPAINTVVNSKAFGDPNDKNVFNQSEPSNDVANFSAKVSSVLQALSAGDTEGPYTVEQADALAAILLPDVLPFDKAGILPPPINGRGLADDVIDTELRVLTGGDPLALYFLGGRDADGAINTDSVGPHTDYLEVFPFLGVPHATVQAVQFAGYFSDDDGSVHESDINWAAYSQVTMGCNPPENSAFCPDSDISRGQFAAFLVRALELEASEVDAFADDAGNVFEADINALAAAGITKGCNPPANTSFCADESVTRGEMAALLVRGLGLTASDTDAFRDDNASIFESDIDALAAAGITEGCNPPQNTSYCVEHNVLRAEMATFLARALS